MAPPVVNYVDRMPINVHHVLLDAYHVPSKAYPTLINKDHIPIDLQIIDRSIQCSKNRAICDRISDCQKFKDLEFLIVFVNVEICKNEPVCNGIMNCQYEADESHLQWS